MKSLSICIPAHEMGGLGHQFLTQIFASLEKQTFRDFDVIVSDQSIHDEIKNVCEANRDRLAVHYYRYAEKYGSSSANLNNAIKKATGALIKILFLDDFLSSPESLADIINAFNLEKDRWLFTACEHTKDGIHFFRPFTPRYDPQLYLGKNTLGAPSLLTIKNDTPLLFDENMIWLMDVDYYKRCHDAFGAPKIVNKIGVVIRVGAHQLSNTLATEKVRDGELRYILKKYAIKLSSRGSAWLLLKKINYKIKRILK